MSDDHEVARVIARLDLALMGFDHAEDYVIGWFKAPGSEWTVKIKSVSGSDFWIEKHKDDWMPTNPPFAIHYNYKHDYYADIDTALPSILCHMILHYYGIEVTEEKIRQTAHKAFDETEIERQMVYRKLQGQ
jgi:hypothetical protein